MAKQPDVSANAAQNDDVAKIFSPIAGSPAMGSPYGPRDGRMHNGVDIPTNVGTPCIAPVDGKITYTSTSGFGESGGMVHFEFQEDLGSIQAGDKIGWGHPTKLDVSAGDSVRGGSQVCVSGYPSAPHVHFVYLPGGGGGSIDGTADPMPIYSELAKGAAPTGGVGGGGGPASGGSASGSSSGFTEEDLFAVGRAAAISTSFTLPGLTSSLESNLMQGAKSIYNDEPLLPFVEQLCKASMRQFQSLPNGAFFAFFPDQFGAYGHRTPYWSVSDVEIIDGKIDLNDDALATHVFVVGDTQGGLSGDGAIDINERMFSRGVITIFDAFASKFMIGHETEDDEEPKGKKGKKDSEETEATKVEGYQNALNFLRKYGMRPHYEEALFIRNPFFEIFYAYTQFQLLWSSQFTTDFTLTFMPELYPGGIVEFEGHDFQAYVDSVTHTFDYEGGFHTQASFSAPSSKKNKGIAKGMAQNFSKDFEGSIAGGLPSGDK